jgi:hypothetical protein
MHKYSRLRSRGMPRVLPALLPATKYDKGNSPTYVNPCSLLRARLGNWFEPLHATWINHSESFCTPAKLAIVTPIVQYFLTSLSSCCRENSTFAYTRQLRTNTIATAFLSPYFQAHSFEAFLTFLIYAFSTSHYTNIITFYTAVIIYIFKF